MIRGPRRSSAVLLLILFSLFIGFEVDSVDGKRGMKHSSIPQTDSYQEPTEEYNDVDDPKYFLAIDKDDEDFLKSRDYHHNKRIKRDKVDEDEEEDYEELLQNSAGANTQPKNMKEGQQSSSGQGKAVQDVNLPPDYNIYQIPNDPFHGGPIPVFVYVHIKKILDLDELSETVKLDIEFQVMWTDFLIMYLNNRTRKADELITIDLLSPEEVKASIQTLNNPYILQKVWKPNLFIEGLLAVRQPILMAKPLTIKFLPQLGWFEYITRISVKLDCEMDFHHYPADTQVCPFAIRGFSYNQDLLNLNWWKKGVYLDDLKLPSFDVQIESTNRFGWMRNNDPKDVFNVLEFKILARRRLSYHLVQTYLASTFYIIITCLCFLLPPRFVEARIGISMTTLLTLTAMFASVRESTPIVSYVKAVDIWMVGCIFFVFLTLSQFTFLILLRSIKQDYDEQCERLRKKDIELVEMTANGTTNSPRHSTQYCSSDLPSKIMDRETVVKYEKVAAIFEKYSFIMFLSIFALYTIFYWSWLITSSDYFDWSVNSTLNNIGRVGVIEG